MTGLLGVSPDLLARASRMRYVELKFEEAITVLKMGRSINYSKYHIIPFQHVACPWARVRQLSSSGIFLQTLDDTAITPLLSSVRGSHLILLLISSVFGLMLRPLDSISGCPSRIDESFRGWVIELIVSTIRNLEKPNSKKFVCKYQSSMLLQSSS